MALTDSASLSFGGLVIPRYAVSSGEIILDTVVIDNNVRAINWFISVQDLDNNFFSSLSLTCQYNYGDITYSIFGRLGESMFYTISVDLVGTDIRLKVFSPSNLAVKSIRLTL